MFVETWTTSLAFQVQPERADAGQPSARSRIAAAIARASASVAGGSSSRLKAISGGRAATSVAPAVGCSSRRAVVGRRAALRAARRVRPCAAPRACARPRARRRGTPGCPARADRVGGQQRLGDRRAALRLLEEHDRRDVERADARVQAVVLGAGRSARPPRRRRPRARGAARPGSPARKKTARWWSASSERCRTSACVANAAPIASSTSSSRPSETLGTATSRVMPRARSARRRARACRRRRASRPRPGTSRWTGTETVPPMPALAPNATWTVPSIFSSSRMLPVSVARSFVPTPSSARLRPCSPRRRPSVAVQRAPHSPRRVGEPAARDGRARRARRRGRASRATRVTSVPSPASGETKPSPQGRFPNAPGARRSPSSAIPSRPVRSSGSRSRAGR